MAASVSCPPRLQRLIPDMMNVNRKLLSSWRNGIYTMAFAPRCILCHVPATLELDLCTECRAELPRQTRACRYCALTLSAGSDTDCCPSCLRGPPFDVAHAAFMYDMPIDWLITRLKFQDRLSHARILGTLLAAHLASEACRPPDCIVPVPLHKKPYRQRGFNQAALLAQVVGRLLDRPVELGLAQRVRATEPQMALPAAARARNVR